MLRIHQNRSHKRFGKLIINQGHVLFVIVGLRRKHLRYFAPKRYKKYNLEQEINVQGKQCN